MSERKPRMSESRRKILNLLEYILEVDNEIYSVYNAFILHVSPVNKKDLNWVEDEEWAQWFEDYASKLSKGGTSKNYLSLKEWEHGKGE